MYLSVVVVFLVVVATVYWWRSIRGIKRPPKIGLWSFFSTMSAHEGRWPGAALHDYCKKLGSDIIRIPFPGSNIILLDSFPVIKQSLIERGREFSERPVVTTPNVGLCLANWPQWHNQRKIVNKVLRQFVLGKRSFEDRIANEIFQLSRWILDLEGAPFNPFLMLNKAEGNVIMSIVCPERFEYSDPTLGHFLQMTHDIDKALGGAFFLPLFVQGYLFPEAASAHKMLQKGNKEFMRFMREHRETIDYQEPRDFIDTYLMEEKKWRDLGNEEMANCYKDEECAASLRDMFLGSETTTTVLYWFILIMAKFPKIQKKLQTLFDDAVGRERFPNMEDLSRLNYFEACILETVRVASGEPTLIPHRVDKVTEFNSFTIYPSDIILANVWGLLHDERCWKKPMEFYPEHFLTPDGMVVRPDNFIPFGVGPRGCPGERLALMEVRIFAAHLIHRFDVVPDPANPLPSLRDTQPVATHKPLPYYVRCLDRYDSVKEYSIVTQTQ